jgi:hypothetical protein
MNWGVEKSSNMEWEFVGYFNNVFDFENFLSSADEWNYSICEGDITVKYPDN